MSAPHHLFVCTSCRQQGDGKEPREQGSGAQLFRNLSERFASWARREDFVIVPYECLSVCARPCGIALRAPGKFTYVFGDLKPGETHGLGLPLDPADPRHERLLVPDRAHSATIPGGISCIATKLHLM